MARGRGAWAPRQEADRLRDLECSNASLLARPSTAMARKANWRGPIVQLYLDYLESDP
jgi:hypothetical protein